MKVETCLVPGHGIPVPPDLRGKRQALFFLLAPPQTVPGGIAAAREHMPGPHPVRTREVGAPAPRRLAAILASDDFQFTF